MSTREDIKRYGHGGKYTSPWAGWVDAAMRFPLTNSYRVEAECTQGERKGSGCSYGAKSTIAEARAHMEALKNSPEGERYDTWYIVRYQPSMTVSVVDEADDDLLG